MINVTQKQLEFPMVMGQPYETLPDDLFIPPNALELCLESFSGPMDLLLYLIKKENINILELDVSEITQQYVQYIELMDILKFELTHRRKYTRHFLNMMGRIAAFFPRFYHHVRDVFIYR